MREVICFAQSKNGVTKIHFPLEAVCIAKEHIDFYKKQ